MTTRELLAFGARGKDVVIVAPAAELATPSSVTLPPAEPAPGLILADGSINWGCPCLGGMATGPCGPQFRDAFSCFHYSEAEPKGSDCYEKFAEMQGCMHHYPELYARDDDDLAAALDESAAAPAPATATAPTVGAAPAPTVGATPAPAPRE